LASRGVVEAADFKDQTYIAYWFGTNGAGFENDRLFPAKVSQGATSAVESLDA
jgi:hypothetical protein